MAFPIDEVGYTLNYNIPMAWIGKPNWYQLYYDAMDIIDTTMKDNADNISINAGDIASLQGSLAGHHLQHEAGQSDEISLSGLSGTDITLNSLYADTITEKTTDAGVTVEGILIKDQRIHNLLDPLDDDEPVNLAYLNSVIQGLDPQESIINFVDFKTAEPTGQSVGDRYIHDAGNGTSSETGQPVVENHIYEWNGTDWTDIPAQDGMYLFVEAEEKFYFYDDDAGSWRLLGSIINHNNLSGKQGGTTDEYYHLTSIQHSFVGSGQEIGFSHNDQLRDLQGGTGAQRYHLQQSVYDDVVDWSNNGIYHNTSLAGLQGGTTGEYYHFTASEHTTLLALAGSGHNGLTGLQGGNGSDQYYHLALSDYNNILDYFDSTYLRIPYVTSTPATKCLRWHNVFTDYIYNVGTQWAIYRDCLSAGSVNIEECRWRSADTDIIMKWGSDTYDTQLSWYCGTSTPALWIYKGLNEVLINKSSIVPTGYNLDVQGKIRGSNDIVSNNTTDGIGLHGRLHKFYGNGTTIGVNLYADDKTVSGLTTLYIRETGHIALDGWFSNGSILGALNELATDKQDTIDNYFTSTTGTVTQATATPTLMTGMSVTVTNAGDYLVSFGTSVDNNANNGAVFIAIYVNSVQQTNSMIQYLRPTVASYTIPVGIPGFKVTASAGQTIEIWWWTNGTGTASTYNGRWISAIKI